MAGSVNAIILKVASLCNINCSYCYIYQHEDQSFRLRPKFISEEVFEATLAAMCRYSDRRGQHKLALTFHGGEPTLIGAERLDWMAARAREVLGPRLRFLALQTNATMIDDALLDVFLRHGFNVGVSLDGPAAVHDQVRVDHAGRGTHARTVAGLRRLHEAGFDPIILCVINPGQSGLEIYRYFRSLGARRMDFLLPDVSHDNKARLYGQYKREPVADYLIPIFNAWFDEDNPEIQIRILWGLTRAIMGGWSDTDAFGNTLMNYLVVEADGSIEALDALRVCEDGITRSGLNVLHDGFDDLERGLPLVHQAVEVGIPLPTACHGCPEQETCAGGYLPHRYSRANGFDNPSVWCADILKLLSHMRRRIAEVQGD